eukprot:Seg7.1 transcript_id=Seg7.1/GoldUCD/mRNA.D3Y31 product="Ephrin type-A receptor 6" protein_id=Seg7.1/GoldUCD/D3Y31
MNLKQYGIECFYYTKPFPTEPPSAPRNVNAASIGSTWAFLRWEKPAKQGTGDTVTYSVDFKQSLLFTRRRTANLYYNLTGLNTYVNYTITVYTVNNVTTATEKDAFSKIHFRTKSGLPGIIQDLRKNINDDLSVTIFWNEPASKGGPDLKYFIQVNAAKGFLTNARNYTIHQRTETQRYVVLIKSFARAGFSKAKKIEFTIHGTYQGSKGKIFIGLIAGILSIAMIIIIITAVCIISRNRKPPPQSDSKDNGKQDTNKKDDIEMHYMDLKTAKMEKESNYATLGPSYEEIGQQNAAYVNIEHS